MMAAFVANLGNALRKKKEDNKIYRFISFVPRKVLEMLRIPVSYLAIAFISLALFVAPIFVNSFLIHTFG
jgi:hypothetical protein